MKAYPLTAVLALLTAASAVAQQQGPQPVVAVPIRFGSMPETVALLIDREGFFDVSVDGPVGVQITLKSVENESIGTQRASALFSLIEPPPATASATTTSTATASGMSSPIAAATASSAAARAAATKLNVSQPVNQIPNGSIGGGDRKRIRFAGAPGAGSIPKVVTIELEAAGGGARAVTRSFNVVLGPDAGLPVIKSAGGSITDINDFPPFSGSPPRNVNDWNIVQTTMEVQIDADNFTVPDRPNVELLALYKVIAEYADGTKWSVSYRADNQATNVSAGATRTVATVPNVDRGGFRILLQTPAGTVRDTRQFTFPANQVTTHPSASCPVTIVSVDQPASVPSENGFWVPVSFQVPALPAQPACGQPYGKWRDVDIETTTFTAIGVANSKITRRPANGSIASNSNMPLFSCNAAGLGIANVNWRAKLDIYVGECADKRIP